MEIDWVTVAAQVVNFLILVWLLKRFLFVPVTKAIATRESEIATRETGMAQATTDAMNREKEYRNKIDGFENRRAEYLATAQEEADGVRKDLERDARRRVEDLETEWKNHLELEHTRYLSELREHAARAIVDLSRQVLKDLADESLEGKLVEEFEKKIKMSGSKIANQISELGGAAAHGLVVTQHALSGEQQASILRTVSDTVGAELDIEFVADASMSAGVLLKVQGLQISWTIDSYLNALVSDLNDYLKSPATEPNA